MRSSGIAALVSCFGMTLMVPLTACSGPRGVSVPEQGERPTCGEFSINPMPMIESDEASAGVIPGPRFTYSPLTIRGITAWDVGTDDERGAGDAGEETLPGSGGLIRITSRVYADVRHARCRILVAADGEFPIAVDERDLAVVAARIVVTRDGGAPASLFESNGVVVSVYRNAEPRFVTIPAGRPTEVTLDLHTCRLAPALREVTGLRARLGEASGLGVLGFTRVTVEGPATVKPPAGD